MYIIYIVLIIAFLVVATIGWAAFSFAPWLPMHSRDLKRVFALLALKEGETFYDLGCGNGKVALYAGKHYDARVTGLELALPLLWLCKLRRLLGRQKNVRFKWRNLFRADLSQADVVYFFGIPSTIKAKLKQKLARELKPGARVVSYAFQVDGWQAAAVSKPCKTDIPIYLYVR